jgi:hypothetical protein
MRRSLRRAFVIVASAVLALTGCQTLDSDNDVYAVIVEPSDASRAALQDTVSRALGTDVVLASDALTRSSMLSIEHNPPRAIDAPPAQGRILDKPVQFRLVKSGDECILVDQRDQSRHILRDTRCNPEEG